MNVPSAPSVSIEVYATGDWIGFHCWPEAPEDVRFLRERHRHKFCWKIWWAVEHGDRQIEFCSMKQRVHNAIEIECGAKNSRTWSCEQWAVFLMEMVNAIRVEVSEDGENGAVVSRA